MPLSILVVGIGIAGPAFATMLQRADPSHRIHLIERSPSLRNIGQQIDLKHWAPGILSGLGVLDTIRSRCVNETGFEVTNARDRRVALFPLSSADRPNLTLTSEYEMMRGDLVDVLFTNMMEKNAELCSSEKGKDVSEVGGIKCEFGKTIDALEQDGKGVTVTFSNGEKGRYDLVIGADGQGSKTRRLAFPNSQGSFKSLGIHGAYFTVPHVEGENTLARMCFATERRWLCVRPSGRPSTGVLFFQKGGSQRMKASYGKDVAEQKAAFAEAFQGCQWQEKRFLEGLKTADDFYISEIGQTKMERLTADRVVLLGDAGYCPSPFTGLGTTLALVGAYCLAGEIARQPTDIVSALDAYGAKMRPFIDECQEISTSFLNFTFCSNAIGVWFLQQFVWLLGVFSALMSSGLGDTPNERKLPEYAELKLVR